MKTNKNFTVTGMTCSACQARVEKSVSALPGIESCSVNLLVGKMNVVFDDKTVNSDGICKAVIKTGYGCKCENSFDKAEHDAEHGISKAKCRLIASVILMILLFYLETGAMLLRLPLPRFISDNNTVNILLRFITATAICILNFGFFSRGIKSVIHLSPNMDTLILFGSGTAYLYSVSVGAVSIIKNNIEMPTLYFEAAAMIVTFVSIGKYLEERSKSKTKSALDSLISLAPETAVRITNGKEKRVLTSQLCENDTVVIRQGDKIPCDGTVISGFGTVNESYLTGESLPSEKNIGDGVICATVCKSGYFTVKCDKVGSDTVFSDIIRKVTEASATKAPIARIADKIAGVFVLCVLGISLLTFAVWLLIGKGVSFALARAIATAVISCPCALGLATPCAIMTGMGKGAGLGILYKNAAVLENIHRVNAVFFDKTGTLTEGKCCVNGIVCINDTDKSELIYLAASLETPSSHPLAVSICDYAKGEGIKISPVLDFCAVEGNGVSGIIDNAKIIGGNSAFMLREGVEISALEAKAKSYSSDGSTVLYFAKNKTPLGIISLGDRIKSDAKKAVSELSRLNIETVMLTGDNKITAEAVRKSIGISKAFSGILPSDKADIIAEYENNGKVACMVGDGVNDAVALAKATVGVAIGTGTDIAKESADAVIFAPSVMGAVNAITLGRATVRIIKQNLFWALCYNVIGIPLAAGVFYRLGILLPPGFSALAMSISSLFVVSNALRLRNFGKEKAKNERVNEMEKIIIIQGMMCAHCQSHAEKALNSIDGVAATVSLEENRAYVKCNSDISNEMLTKAIEDEGYTVTEIKEKV